MLNIRPIFFAVGLLGALISCAMLVPAVVDLLYGNPDWKAFFVAASFGLAVNGMVLMSTKGSGAGLGTKQVFLMLTLAWSWLPFLGSLPLMFSEYQLSMTDAYFEAIRGMTTTGSTILSGLDSAPPGFLLWRAMLQWLGGFGVVVMAVALLPLLQIGGMQVFRLETGDTNEKILPKATQISVAITGLYISFTALCAILLILAGMSPFDATAHAMAAISTGGYSTHDASVGYFDSGYVDLILVVFMLIGSFPFVLYLQVLRGRPMAFWRDEQVRGFAGVIVFIILAVSLWLVIFKGFTPIEAVRFGGFNIISVMTGTGFASTDYGQWGSFSATLFFLAMFIGGCTGSTSCGIKIFRFQVLFKTLRAWQDQVIMPNGVFVARYNGRRITSDIQSSVLSFFSFFILCLLVLTFLLTLTGMDWLSALSGAGTVLANVGPGLGDTIGPAGNFASLSDPAKWLLSFGMLLGRLELFTVLVLFTPGFWRV